MPRDNDKNNDSRGRRDRPPSGKGRSGAARGPEKKFAKRGFAGKGEGEKRPYAGRRDDAKPFGKKPYAGAGKPYAGKREGAPPRRDYDDAPRPPRFNRDDRPRGDGEKRPYTPRGDRPNYNRDDRAPRGERGESRPASRFADKKFGDKRPYTPREGGGEKRPYTPRGDRPERKFGGDNKFSRGAPRDRKSDPGDRGPRKDFGSRDRDRKSDPGDRGDSKPWQKRDASSPDHVGRNSRPSREGSRNFEKRSFDKPRFDKPREERGGGERPRFSRSREDRPGGRPFRERPKFDRPREDRPKFERPREARTAWQEDPRSDTDRPRRDNEDDSKNFAKRPAFGGRGAYRERAPDERRPPRPPPEKKSAERSATVVSRAGPASRRDAEEWIVPGRVTANARVINSPALHVTTNDVITYDR